MYAGRHGSWAGRVAGSGGLLAASAAGIVRSGFGACRDVRGRGDRNELFFRTGCHRRRGRGSSGSPAPLRGRDANVRPRHADLPGPAGRHRAAGHEAQTTTVTQSGAGATWSLVGENTVAAGQQTYTYTLTRTSGSLPQNEYFGFTSNTLEAERFQYGYSDCTGTNYFCFTISDSEFYQEYTVSGVRFAGISLEDISPHVLTLKVATGTPTGTTVTLGVVNGSGIPRSGGLLITVGTATTNTAPTAADKTVTTGEDRAYAFTADDFGFDDDDAGDTLASVSIVTVPSAGTLALDGTAVLADDVVTKAQIDGDMLTFTPARDAHGDPYTTFTFTVNDGTDDSASAYTMTIDVTDAPAPVCGVPGIAGAGRRQIWSGTVMVERIEFLGVVSYGFAEGHSAGTLLPSQSFFIGSNNYVIDAIAVAISGSMEFSLDGFVQLTDRENAALRLHVCDGDYDFNTADDTTNPIIWSTTLDWSPPVVTRTVYLSLPANNAATGAPTITGTAQAGQELTADASPIMDTDGLTGVSYSYQWVRVDADGTSNEEDISGEIAETYTLTNDDRRRTNEKDDFRVPGRHHADGGIRPGAGRRLVGHFHTRRYQWIRVRLPKWRR